MHTNDYLFPARLSRRDFITAAGTVSAGLWLAGCETASSGKAAPVRIGSGRHTYTAVPGWGTLPQGMGYGLGCGVVVDGKDRVYVTSRSTNPAVAVFDRHGKLLEVWGQAFADKVGLSLAQVKDTAHCLYWSREGSEEFFYWTENISTNKVGSKFGARVYKTDLQGRILYQIGRIPTQGSTAQAFDFTNPTDVAVAPGGDIYVVDGYGSQLVHRFDRNFRHIRTIGGRGKETGKFNTCHGVWVKTGLGEPEVYIADRHNDRVQVFDLELNLKRVLSGRDFIRNPCCFYQHRDQIYIPDLASRVTILDGRTDKVLAHLGDGREADGKTKRPDAETNPTLFAAPHALCVDSRGDLYTVEWVANGRPRKWRHTPA